VAGLDTKAGVSRQKLASGVLAGSIAYLNRFARRKNDKRNDESRVYSAKMAQLDMMRELQAGSEAFPHSIDAQRK
jgi:hypothetical protein